MATSRTKCKVCHLLHGAHQTYLAHAIPGFIDDGANSQILQRRSPHPDSQSPSSSTLPLPQSDTSHDRHDWVDHLAARYASGQGQTLHRPSLPMDDGDCPLEKHILERVYTDPYIYIVLLYCKVGIHPDRFQCV